MNRNGQTMLWLTGMAIMLIWLVTNIKINTDLTEFLPADDSIGSEIINHQLNEGPASRSLLLAITGGTRDEKVAASQELTRRLAESSHFSQINNGEKAFTEDDLEWVISSRYLLSDRVNASLFTESSLREKLEQRLQELRSSVSILIKKTLPNDPTSETLHILQAWSQDKKPANYEGVWFSKDFETAIIVAETSSPGWDVDLQEPVIHALQQNFDEISNNSALELGIYGTGYYSVYSKNLIQFEATLFSLVASLALVLILFIFYRQPVLVVLSAIPLLSAVVGGATVVQLFFNHIHGITLAFGITLLGITLDYPIHVFSHAQQLNSKFWSTLYTGAITTIIAFAIFFLTDIQGLAELGLFTLSGLAFAVITSRWIIPLWTGSSNINQENSFAMMSWVPGLVTRFFILLLVAVFIASAFFLQQLEWEDDLSALSPLPAKIIDQQGALLEQLGKQDNSRYLIAIHADKAETVLQQTEKLSVELQRLVNQGALQQYEAVTRYLPSMQQQQQRQNALPNREILQQNLQAAVEGLPFKPGLFATFLDEVESASKADLLHPAQFSDSLINNKTSSLLYQQADSQWLSVIPLTEVEKPDQLQKLIAGCPENNCLLLDMATNTSEMVRSFRLQAGERIGISILLMLGLLLFSIRNVKRLGRVVVSLTISLLLTISTLMLMNIPLSLFHFISLLLVAGIGLDYALFFSLDAGNDKRQSSTLKAISVCALSTITVFGILAFSNIYVLKAIGFTTMTGVIFAYLSTWIFSRPLRVNKGTF